MGQHGDGGDGNTHFVHKFRGSDTLPILKVRRVARGILYFLTCGPFARNASLPDSYRILPPVTLYLFVHVETGYGVAGGGHWRCLRWSPAMPDATPTTEQKRASGERPGEAGLCRPLRLDEQLRLGLL